MAALVGQGSAREHRSGFGQAIAFDNYAAGGFFPLLGKRGRQRHRARHRVANGRDVRVRLARLAQDALKHRRNAHEERHRTAFMRVESHLRIKLRQQHLRRRLTDRGAQEEGQPKRMEIGEQREEGLRSLV